MSALPFSYDREKTLEVRRRIQIQPDPPRALYIAERGRADFVYHTAALEGNPFTFPEVQTLLDGITVGGHKLSDAEQVLRLNRALTYIIAQVKSGSFALTAEAAKTIQALVAENEALAWGTFRSGAVFIAGADYEVPRAEDLPEIFEKGRQALNALDDPIERAFLVFLWGSIVQFFYDGNKRTSRFLCNGILMTAGYPPMMITAKEQLAYNQIMTDFYNTQEATQALIWFYERYLDRLKHFGVIER